MTEETKKPILITKPRPIVGSSRVHRNKPCPCGSGRKFKKCHLNQAIEVMNGKG